MDKVLLDKHEGFAILTLNRPEAMNALSRELRADFVAAFRQCTGDPDTRVVILTGAGKAFCAGFDLKELGDSGDTPADEADNTIARAMADFEGPIIGAINGHAVTGGFEMALACDVLIASEYARFADTHARVGILPGWGLSQRLPRLIGLSRAKQLAFTGKPLFAQQAYEWGLVNELVPADELMPTAIAMAQAMCGCVPHILRRYKALIDRGYSMPLDEALRWEEQQAIASAREVAAADIAQRRDNVIEQGRSEKNVD
jgi:enoyl-CoA hydratase